MNIEIFHSKMCWACEKAIEYFENRDLAIKKYEVSWECGELEDSENAREMKKRCGEDVDFVPQIFINGKHVPGWKGLSALIESGEIEQLLKDGD